MFQLSAAAGRRPASQPGPASCSRRTHGPTPPSLTRQLGPCAARAPQFLPPGLLLGPSCARPRTAVRDSSSGGSGEWEAKAPLRAVVNTRSRSPDSAPAAAASAFSLGDPSPQDLLLAAADLANPPPPPHHPETPTTQLQPSTSQSQPSGPAGSSPGSAAAVNIGIIAVLAAVAAAKFISVDAESWDHLSVWQLLQQMPESNWRAYDAAVNSNPMFTKACISGTVYTLGDCIAQGVEGRSLGELDRARILRSGTCGFIAHGPLSHLYYQNLDYLFSNVLMVPPSAAYLPFLKLGIDQTIWSLFWNSLYYALLGALKLEHPSVILRTVQSSWLDLLKAGWKLWPFAHIITYGFIPVQHRLLWVDSVELVWVTFLSLYGQEQREKLAAAAGQATAAAPGPAAAPGGPAANDKP